MRVILTTGRIVTIDWFHERRMGTTFLPISKVLLPSVPSASAQEGATIASLDVEGLQLYKRVQMPKSKGGKTHCTITVSEKDMTVNGLATITPIQTVTAIATCSKNDNYCKAIGRKKSLDLALKLLKFDLEKDDRSDVYTYLKQHSVSLMNVREQQLQMSIH